LLSNAKVSHVTFKLICEQTLSVLSNAKVNESCHTWKSFTNARS